MTPYFGKLMVPVIALMVMMGACKKEKSEGNSDGNSYSYQKGEKSTTLKIKLAENKIAGRNHYLFFSGDGPTDQVQIMVQKEGSDAPEQIPEGTFSKEISGGYRFFNGSLIYGDGLTSPMTDTDRSISIAKEGSNYRISFEYTTEMGLVKGNYTGPIVKRN